MQSSSTTAPSHSRRIQIISQHLSLNTTSTQPLQTVDVLIIGAGFAGMYMTHKLLKTSTTSQLNIQILEAGTNVGGTWTFNRYPGARCDVPSIEYSFSNDAYEGLEQSWVGLICSLNPNTTAVKHVLTFHSLFNHLLYRHLLYRHWIIPKSTRPSLDLRSPSADLDRTYGRTA